MLRVIDETCQERPADYPATSPYEPITQFISLLQMECASFTRASKLFQIHPKYTFPLF